MAKTVLVHYKHPALLNWSLVDEQGNTSTPPTATTLEELAPVAKDTRITLLLDSSLIYFDHVSIPSNNRSQQLRAAPFLLEEKLATDIEFTHFVLGKREANGDIPVACINKPLLRSILDQFVQSGIDIESVCPDVLALPYTPGHWTVLIDAQSVHIKTTAQSGYFFDRTNTSTIFPSLVEQDNKPAAFDIYTVGHDSLDIELPEDLNITLNHYTYTQSLAFMAKNIRDARAMNLLQGEFAIKRKSGLSLQGWGVAAGIAAIWLVLQLLLAAVEIHQLDQKNMEITAAVENEFKSIFPDAKKFSGMKPRVKKRLEELRGGGDEQHFLPMLIAAAPILANEGISIHALAYREKHIDMELKTNSLDKLESAKTRLESLQGIKTVLSTSMEKDKITGRLRMEHQG